LVEGFVGGGEDNVFGEGVAVEVEGEGRVSEVGAFLVIDISGALLVWASICSAVRERVGDAFDGVLVDGLDDGIAPLVSCTVEEVGAIVPEDCGGVVLGGCADEEVEVAPACCGLGCYW
jgi:hypothetical protein